MGRKSNLLRAMEEVGRYRLKPTADSLVIKKKGGLSGEAIKKDIRFEKSVNENKLFKNYAEQANLLRIILAPLLKDMNRSDLNGRLIGLMRLMKKEGEQALNGFEFNSDLFLKTSLNKTIRINEASLNIKDLVTAYDIGCPEGATHVSLQGGQVYLNFKEGTGHLIQSKIVTLAISQRKRNITLLFQQNKKINDLKFYVLKLSFFKEKFPIGAKRKNVMAILGDSF